MEKEIQIFNSPQFGEVLGALARKGADAAARVGGWLDGRSAFYSRAAGFDVTRRAALAVNALFLLLLVAAASAPAGCWPLAVAALAAMSRLVAWLKRYDNDLKGKGGER